MTSTLHLKIDSSSSCIDILLKNDGVFIFTQLLTSGAAAEKPKSLYAIGISSFSLVFPQFFQNFFCLHNVGFYTAKLTKYPNIMEKQGYTNTPVLRISA